MELEKRLCILLYTIKYNNYHDNTIKNIISNRSIKVLRAMTSLANESCLCVIF